MLGRQTLKDHETLMARMARKLGTDLDAAEMRGDLTPDLRAEMLAACVGCSQPAGCKEFLGSDKLVEAAPAFCRNGTLLMALRAG